MSALNSLLIHDRHIGTVREATADEIITAARACVAKRMRRGASLTSPKAARDYLVLRFAELQHEVFCVTYLDSRHRVIECPQVCQIKRKVGSVVDAGEKAHQSARLARGRILTYRALD